MADTKTTAETANTTLTGTELVRGVQGGGMVKIPAEQLGHQFRGARVRITSDKTTIDMTTAYTITWDAAAYDTDSFWSGAAATKLTIPEGKKFAYVNASAWARIDAATNGEWVAIFLQQFTSGNTQKGSWINYALNNGATKQVSIATLGIDVADGDYFLVKLQTQADTSVTITTSTGNISTGASIQVVGMTA